MLLIVVLICIFTRLCLVLLFALISWFSVATLFDLFSWWFLEFWIRFVLCGCYLWVWYVYVWVFVGDLLVVWVVFIVSLYCCVACGLYRLGVGWMVPLGFGGYYVVYG